MGNNNGQKSDDYLIRLATAADAGRISEIAAQCLSGSWSQNLVARDIKNAHTRYLVALDQETIVGFVACWLVAPEAEIIDVAVLPCYRGRGIAQRMFKELFALMTGLDVKLVFLDVRETNLPARSLYEKLGFVDFGRREGYYTDTGEDGLSMKKTI